MKKHVMLLYRILFTMGLLLAVFPFAQFWWLTNGPDFSPAAPNADIIRASEGIGSSSAIPYADFLVLQEAAAQGNALAQNNLAVDYLRSPRPGSREAAHRLLELASAQGLIQARYNLALILPHEFDTDPEIIRQQIDLLQANVREGDVHSMVLLARFLYFSNRDTYVEDKNNYILDLYAEAALSGDSDYIYQFAHRIKEDHRRGRPADLVMAAEQYLQVAALGDPRGAHGLGELLEEQGMQDVVEYLIAEGQPISPLYWYDLGAQGGLRAAACEYGRYLFRDIMYGEPQVQSLQGYWAWISDRLKNLPNQTLRQGMLHLNDCGTVRAPNRSFRRVVFGEDALYRSKRRGTWPGTHGWAGQADRALGLIAAFGPDQDRVQARVFFERARDDHDEQDMDQLIAIVSQ